MTTKEKLKKRHEENLKRLEAFCLMDDEFMTACFENNLEGVELVLRIILDELDLIVEDVKVQHFIKNLQKRSVRLDIFATNSTGRKFNIEIQREDKGAGVKRARYNSSLIDARVLNPGDEFEKLPETYVIFITENDVLGGGKPLYHIERCVLETGKQFGDAAHIIYVNGTYRGDTPLGRLMEDFHCTDASEMYYNELAKRVRYFKETKEGAAIMSRVMEEMIEQALEEGRLECQAKMLRTMYKNGLSVEKLAEIVDMPVEEIQRLLEV